MLKVEFEMKDLGSTKRILGMEIERDRSKKVLRLSQKSYISKVLSRFEMNNVKTVSTPLGQHFRLSITQAPETHEEKRFMEMIPYASMVGSVMYTMVCSRPDLAYAVSMISRYMSCPGKPHWQAVNVWRSVSWKANLQSVVALSTTEYMAMTEIGVRKVHTKDNPSDMLTKSLNVTKFKHCLNLINMGDC
ncbi:hypothetical protein AAG906_012988 [Vitis piasezkii]